MQQASFQSSVKNSGGFVSSGWEWASGLHGLIDGVGIGVAYLQETLLLAD